MSFTSTVAKATPVNMSVNLFSSYLSFSQVKKSTLNPNAKEFNPVKPQMPMVSRRRRRLSDVRNVPRLRHVTPSLVMSLRRQNPTVLPPHLGPLHPAQWSCSTQAGRDHSTTPPTSPTSHRSTLCRYAPKKPPSSFLFIRTKKLTTVFVCVPQPPQMYQYTMSTVSQGKYPRTKGEDAQFVLFRLRMVCSVLRPMHAHLCLN